MSYLGTWLELADGARLTSIGLTPFSRDVTDQDARIFLHRVRIDADLDGATVAGALAAFLPSSVATLAGNEPDGRTWGAVVQYAPEVGVPPMVRARADRGLPRLTRSVADAGVRRALGLISVDGPVVAATFSDIDLRIPYTDAGADVTDWGAVDLVVGLLYELATDVDLGDLASEVANGDLADENGRDYRAERMHELLLEWAATYEGPRA
jgi:hypothetical protein